MSHAPTVFISAATIDLRPWRELLAKAFRAAQFRVLVQDDSLGAPLGNVRDLLSAAVCQSDCVIHLAGMGYGADASEPFPAAPDFRCSWTQFEYYHAHEKDVPAIAFVCAPVLSKFEREEDSDPTVTATKADLQQAHRKRVENGKFDGTPLAARPRTLNDGIVETTEDLLIRMTKAVATLQRQHSQLQTPAFEQAKAELDALRLLHTIPPPRVDFVGRQKELDQLRDLAIEGGAAITGLKGMGGIGKTQLAYVLAAEWAPQFPDAWLLLDGRGTQDQPSTSAALLGEVILAFEPQRKLPEDENQLKALYRQTLSGKKALILLDNAKDTAQAAPLVPPSGNALIVTSRRGLMLAGRASLTIGRMEDEDAAKLLKDAYGKLTDGEVSELIRLCAGLPLALRLAASHLAFEAAERDGVADVSRYLAALGGGRLKHLDAEAEDAGEVTISETLRLSVEPLPEEEKRAWHRLAIFTASFRAEAAEAIAGAGQGMLVSFLRRSLLEAEGADRYKLHDLAADYARRTLSLEVIAALTLSHASHYTTVAYEATGLYLKGDALGGLSLFDRERTQIGAAWGALEEREDETADHYMVELLNAVAYACDLRFHARQRIAWLEAQLRSARRIGNRQAEGYALGNLGAAHGTLGDARTAIGYHEQALAVSREIGDRRAEGQDLGNLGNAHAALGDTRTAIGHHEQALAVSREIGDRRAEGQDLGNLGNAHAALGDTMAAIGCYEQALAASREIGDRRGEGNSLGNLGRAHAALGDAQTAIRYYEDSLKLTRESGDRLGEGASLGNLGNAYAALGDARTAIDYYDQRLEIALEIGDRRGEGTALWNSARRFHELGETTEALDRAKRSLSILEVIEHPAATMVRDVLAEWRAEAGRGTG